MTRSKIRRLIDLCRVVELNVKDETVQACIVAVSMDQTIGENMIGEAFMNAYRSQAQPFIRALQSTGEFKVSMQMLMEELAI